MNILVSACLLGVNCRYDGTGKLSPAVHTLLATHHLIPFCPEVYGGLGIPRAPAEICGGRVLTASDEDVTAQYEAGAREALLLAELCNCKLAILKERSPSCGHGMVHDGSFTGRLTEGDGITAALVAANGITVIGDSEIETYFKENE